MQEENAPLSVQTLCHNFAEFKEKRFANPLKDGRRRSEEIPWPHKHLTWASLNVRSIYGREEVLMNLMRDQQISIMALQDTFERANDPPIGLLESTYSKPGANGRRGIMIIAHPLHCGKHPAGNRPGGRQPQYTMGKARDRHDHLFYCIGIPTR